MIWIPVVFLFLFAVAFLCGYTTIRFPVGRKEGKRHIACVGDSITYGCSLPLFFVRRYPAVLQRLLGSEVQVATFAVNARTVQNTGDKPYRKTKAFRESMDYLPDTVIILLGTNDSKENNWISDKAFREQYRELVAEYQALSSRPRILLCTPPCAFSASNCFFRMMNDAKFDRIPKIADQIRAAAEENGLELVDLYALTAGRRELLGPDGLHPSSAGAIKIAERILTALK